MINFIWVIGFALTVIASLYGDYLRNKGESGEKAKAINWIGIFLMLIRVFEVLKKICEGLW